VTVRAAAVSTDPDIWLCKTELRYRRHADGDGYPLHMVTDSVSLFLDNGLIRKHLLEFVARHFTPRQAATIQYRDQAVGYKSIIEQKSGSP